MRKIIFDLDLTLVDTTIVEQARHDRNWQLAYSLIPKCKLYEGMEEVLAIIRNNNVNRCVVRTAPRRYVDKVVGCVNLPIKGIV